MIFVDIEDDTQKDMARNVVGSTGEFVPTNISVYLEDTRTNRRIGFLIDKVPEE